MKPVGVALRAISRYQESSFCTGESTTHARLTTTTAASARVGRTRAPGCGVPRQRRQASTSVAASAIACRISSVSFSALGTEE